MENLFPSVNQEVEREIRRISNKGRIFNHLWLYLNGYIVIVVVDNNDTEEGGYKLKGCRGFLAKPSYSYYMRIETHRSVMSDVITKGIFSVGENY